MKSYICSACGKGPCKYSGAEKPSLCLRYRANGANWQRKIDELGNKLFQEEGIKLPYWVKYVAALTRVYPVLTLATLGQLGIKWPNWARYAVVNCIGIGWFSSGIPESSTEWWEFGVARLEPIEGYTFDATDWRNSLIDRCSWWKKGARFWTPEYGYGTVLSDEKPIGKYITKGECALADWRMQEARVAPVEELPATVIGKNGTMYYKRPNGIYIKIYPDGEAFDWTLVRSVQVLSEIGRPSGILQHFNGKEWVE